MKKRMLADVLWDAANKHLWDGVRQFTRLDQEFTCHAVYESIDPTRWRSCGVNEFFESLGANLSGGGFDKFGSSEKRQGARYLWLLLAMHIAEDEGIEIEVPA